MSETQIVFDPTLLLQRWNLTLSDVRPARAQTQIFDVVQDNGEAAILKVYRAGDFAADSEAPRFLRLFEGDAIVKPLAIEPGAMLLERLDGEMLLQVAWRGDDEKATDVIIDLAEKIRSKRKAFVPAMDLSQRFQMIEKTHPHKYDALSGEAVRQAVSIATETLKRDQSADRGLLHGDLHHANVLHSARGWTAIDPKVLLGSPEAEFAQAFCNPSHLKKLVGNPIRALAMSRQISTRTGFRQLDLLSWAVTMATYSLFKEVKAQPEGAARISRASDRLDALLEARASISTAL